MRRFGRCRGRRSRLQERRSAGATTYAGPWQWSQGQGAGGSFSSSWKSQLLLQERLRTRRDRHVHRQRHLLVASRRSGTRPRRHNVLVRLERETRALPSQQRVLLGQLCGRQLRGGRHGRSENDAPSVGDCGLDLCARDGDSGERRWSPASSETRIRRQFHAGLADRRDPRHVADIAAGDGMPVAVCSCRSTERAVSASGRRPSASSQQRQGGCNSVDDPLGRQRALGEPRLRWWARGRGRAGRAAHRAGSRDVATVQVLMSDGTQRRDAPRKDDQLESDEYRAFGYRFKKVGPRGGVGPTAVDLYGSSDGRRDRETVDGHRRLTIDVYRAAG